MRKIHEVARDIEKAWGNKVSPYAKPYLQAMKTLSSPSDYYLCDSGQGIILRFLCNAQGFRGEDARRLKAELKAISLSSNG